MNATPHARERVVVLVRAGCHLCDAAVEAVAGVCRDLAVTWRVEDVDADPELRARYGDHVPVTFVDGVRHSYWFVEEARLRAALAIVETQRSGREGRH